MSETAELERKIARQADQIKHMARRIRFQRASLRDAWSMRQIYSGSNGRQLPGINVLLRKNVDLRAELRALNRACPYVVYVPPVYSKIVTPYTAFLASQKPKTQTKTGL